MVPLKLTGYINAKLTDFVIKMQLNENRYTDNTDVEHEQVFECKTKKKKEKKRNSTIQLKQWKFHFFFSFSLSFIAVTPRLISISGTKSVDNRI